MNIFRLVTGELRYRYLTAAFSLLAVSVAVAVLVSARASLLRFNAVTEAAAVRKEAEVRAGFERFQDEMRRITLAMGFNLAILPQQQSLAAYLAGESPGAWMPETDGDALAARRPATVNHLAPVLQGRVRWPERNREVAIVGVKGEVFMQSARQIPIQEKIVPGTLVLGSQLAADLGIVVGDTVMFRGEKRQVSAIKAGRGGADDITIWLELGDAQRLLGHPGKISAILALECECGTERLAAVRREVHAVLPTVQFVEFSNIASARAEARQRAAALAAKSADDERAARLQQRTDREGLSAALLPMAVLGAVLVVASLAALNARERSVEIGLFRAIGLAVSGVFQLFIGRAVAIGLAGGLLGLALGDAMAWCCVPSAERVLPGPGWSLAVLLLVPVVTALAATAPVLHAVLKDPAEVLRED